VATPVNANYISGTFVLALDQQFSDPIPYDVSAANLATTLVDSFAEIVSVSVTRSDPDEQYGFSWTITFTDLINDGDMPQLSGTPSLVATGAQIDITSFITENSVAGSFALGLVDGWTSALAYDITAEDMAVELQSLYSEGVVTVDRTGPTTENGYTWCATFSGSSYDGDVETLTVDSASLTGDGVGVTIIEQVKGYHASGTSLAVSFEVPDSHGGVPVSGYRLQWSTSPTFDADVHETIFNDAEFLYQIQTVVVRSIDRSDVSGSFQLSYAGETTESISVNATAFEMRVALENLDSIDAVEVAKSGSFVSTDYSVAATNDLYVVNVDSVNLTEILSHGDEIRISDQIVCVGASSSLEVGLVETVTCSDSNVQTIVELDATSYMEISAGGFEWQVTFVQTAEQEMLTVQSHDHLSLSPSDSFIEVVGRDCASCTYLTNLNAGDTYYARVYAMNDFGEHEDSSNIASETAMTVPGIPRNVLAEVVSAEEVEVFWSAPLSDGGSAITVYEVQFDTSADFSSPQSTLYTPDTSVSEYDVIISGLVAGTTYFVRVGAQNDVPFQLNIDGTTNQNFEVSSVSSVVPADIAPNAPTLVEVRRLSATSLRAWITPPARTGGAPITTYSLNLGTSSDLLDSVVLSHDAQDLPQLEGNIAFDVTNLTSGVVYYANTFATTSIGNSTASSSIAYAVPAAHPGAVDTVELTSVLIQDSPITTAQITWSSLQLDEGGSAIESYTAEWWKVGSVAEVQVLSFSYATGGTFEISYRGTDSGPIEYDISGEDLRWWLLTAFDAAGLDEIQVTKDTTALGFDYQISFIGNEGNVPAMTCDASSLTTDAVPATCTISERVVGIRDGGVGEVQKIAPSDTPGGWLSFQFAGSASSPYVYITDADERAERIKSALEDLSTIGIVNVNEVDADPVFWLVTFDASVGNVEAIDVDDQHLNSTVYIFDGDNAIDTNASAAVICEECVVGEQPLAYASETLSAADRSFSVDDLESEEFYSARVIATNARGNGVPMTSTPATYQMPAQAPGQPTDVSLSVDTGSPDSLVLSFASPVSDGGSDILLYKAEWCALSSDASEAECFWQALEGTVTKNATDDERTMDSDDIRCASFPYQAVYVITTNTSADLEFVLSVDGEDTLPIPTNASAMAIDETSGTYYCTDDIEASCSRDSELVGSMQSYLEDLPSISSVKVKRSNTGSEQFTFTVTFTDDRDIDVQLTSGSGVDITKTADGLSAMSSCTGSYVINGLTNGQEYLARVYAYNSVGFSLPQVASTSEKPQTTASAPTVAVLSVVSDSSLRVIFNVPLDDGGDSVTEYMVELDSSSSFDSGTSTTVNGHTFEAEFLGPVRYLSGGSPFTSTFAGLETGTTYYARVRALNSQGYGSVALTSPESEVPRRTPGAPSNVAVYSASFDAITVSFNDPIDDGGETIDFYKIEWDLTPTCNSNAEAPNKGTVVVSASQYNYYTISDLSNTTQYFVKVSAANSMGYGPSIASSPSAVTPSLQKPGKATSLAVYPSGSDTLISWSAPTQPWFDLPCNGTDSDPGSCPYLVAEGGSEIKSYTIYISDSSNFAVASGEITVEHTAGTSSYTTIISNGLSSGDYYVRIFVSTAVGISPASETLTFTV